jgi:hypothetical protein
MSPLKPLSVRRPFPDPRPDARPLPEVGGKLAPGQVRRDPHALGELEELRPLLPVAGLGPWIHRTLVQRPGRVRHDQGLVVLEGGPEPGAGGAGAVGRVEREELGRRLGKVDVGVIGAAEALGEEPGPAFPVVARGIRREEHPAPPLRPRGRRCPPSRRAGPGCRAPPSGGPPPPGARRLHPGPRAPGSFASPAPCPGPPGSSRRRRPAPARIPARAGSRPAPRAWPSPPAEAGRPP